MEIIAIDLGNKQIKLKSRLDEFMIPTQMVDCDSVPSTDSLGKNLTLEFKDVDVYTPSLRPETHYYLGEVAPKLISNAVPVTSLGFGTRRYESLNYQMMMEYALGKLGKAFFAENPDLKILDVQVMVGLPTEDFMQPFEPGNMDSERGLNEKVISYFLKGSTSKVHTICLNGEYYGIRVVDVWFTPQYMGTVRSLKTAKDYVADKQIGVVDIGGGTIMTDAVFGGIGGNVESQITIRNGVYKGLRKIARETRIPEWRVMEIIKANATRDIYEYTPENKDYHVDITDVVRKYREEFTNDMINVINHAFPNFEEIAMVFLTGGGAKFAYIDMLEEEFGQIKRVRNPEMSNVRGNFALAVETYGSPEYIALVKQFADTKAGKRK